MPQPRGWRGGGRFLMRITGRTVGVAAGLLVAGNPAAAQTLTEAFAYAYNNNPQLLAQRASLRATDETVPQALANWRPTVTFNANAGFNRAGFEQRTAAGAPTPTQFSSFVSRSMDVSVAQPIYRGGRTE